MSDVITGTGGDIISWFELWRATIDNRMVEDVSQWMVSGSVDMNHDRAITGQAAFTMRDASVINPYADFLAVFQNIRYADGRPAERAQLGLFTAPVPSGTRTAKRAEGTYTGYDITHVLQRRAFADTYNIAAGTNYVAAVTAILTLAGITRWEIEPTSRVLADPLTFPIGTTYLEACNALLEAIGYYYLAATADGRPTSRGTRDVQYIEPFRRIADADLMGEVPTQPTDTTVANIVIVVNDNPSEPSLTAIRRNDAADSPTSTVNLGPITRIERRSNLADQAAVDALADRLLSEGRTFYQVASLRLLPDPRVLAPHQTIDLNLTGKLAIFNGRWRVRTASVGSAPDQAGPSLEVNRITDTIRGAII